MIKMKSPKISFLQDLKWELYMLKLNFIVASIDRKNRHLRRRYCRHGIHKIKIGHISRISSTEERTLHYIYCDFCNYKFFATESDKEWYSKRY